jgi:hypothetical protein
MVWNNILWFGVAFLSIELFSLFIFYQIRKKYAPANHNSGSSVIKGMLERFAVLLGLAAQIPTIIIFFSALKLGTRLKEQQEPKISNDYFLVGNVTSIIIAITEYLIYQKLNACY